MRTRRSATLLPAKNGCGAGIGCKTPRREDGFTIIELLTVLAVMIVLLAIIIPTVVNVRVSAKIATSTSNLRQIGVAIQLYIQDNNGKLPVANDTSDGNKLWIDQLWPYSNPNEERIPFTGNASADILKHTIYYTPMVEQNVSNSRAFGFNGYIKRNENDRFTNFEDTANLALVGDTARSSALTVIQINFRNRGNANILFADSRVELRSRESVPVSHQTPFWRGRVAVP
jgi:prepilin-type processing-associated H-X9-DG protein